MKQGFSLVELSIVLVILGLLVGGVLTGQSLIKAAELRAITTEYDKYQAAMHTFRDKYFQLPGDMSNATSFWGAAHATPATCRTTASTTTATCDGNADGAVNSVDGGTTYSEQHRFWQHLANAGLLEGSYTGVAGAGGINHVVPGTNAPRSKFTNAGWSAWWSPSIVSGDATYFEGSYGNLFVLGGSSTTASTNTAIFRPEDLWNVDTKMDDGKPGLGALRTVEAQTNCNTTAVAATAAYRLDYTSAACTAFLLMKM